MKKEIKNILLSWLNCLLLLLLLNGCNSPVDDGGTENPSQPKGKPVLKIYLFAPDSPIVTRASTGYVDASDAEKEIHTIDVWVFEHELPNKKVSYIHLDNLSFTGQKEIAMEISNQFAELPKKPNVDIYVVANKESCGLQELGKETTLDELKEAGIGTAYFGAANPVNEVSNMGLPMSGILENQIISGIPPVYTAMSNNVKLVRAVSKIRFILTKSKNNPPTISNLSIKLNANMIPNAEYLFLNGIYPDQKIRIKIVDDNDYEPEATLLPVIASPTIYSCETPTDYAYTTETGQNYENKINNGLKDPDGPDEPDLTQVGVFYLRESDKKLEGTISYTVVTETGNKDKTASFIMDTAGDFTRNHTWIVYGYFLGSGDLKLNIVDVKGWTDDSDTPKVYNW
jgi:hypothetical protein